ncbi:MAG TPA: helix-turn-helix domain-containing protein [Gemmataceae bacterium]|nr:helix-turn-helix domain-containing protein [Gemmataceae bacterium]
MSKMLTLTQAAKRAMVSVTTLRRMIRDGEFPQPVRRNRRWVRVPATDVETYLKNLEARRQPASA